MAQTNEPLESSCSEQFRKIQLTFVAGLPRRLEEIQQVEDPVRRQVALHRLAGAAGGYGFAHLGDMARDAMAALQANSEPALDQALKRLGQAIDAACHTESD